MTRFSALLPAGILALACTIAPAVADQSPAATAASMDHHYETRITAVYGSQYPIAGHLDLEIFPSGIVRGYYHDAFQKLFIPITGGRDAGYIWFDIGPSNVDLGFPESANGRVHVIGSIDADGSIHGQIFQSAIPTAGSVTQTVAPSVQHDQYTFVATPVVRTTATATP